MKRKMTKVIGGAVATLALSLFASFQVEASEIPVPVAETEVISTTELIVEEIEAVLTTQPEAQIVETISEAVVESEYTNESEWANKVIANVLGNVVNVREGTSTDTARLGTLAHGGVAEILERGDEWTKIKSGEIEGYIYNKYLAFDQEAEVLAKEHMQILATVTCDALNVRQEPNTNCTVLKSVYEGDKLEVAKDQEGIQITEGWVPIQLGDNRIAYVSAGYVEVEKKLEEAKPIRNASIQPALETLGASAATAVVYDAPAIQVSQSDLDIMAAIIECEAGGESYEGMIGVGAVVMNRVNSPSFPNSISEVIYQSGQFEPVGTGWFQQVLARGARSDCYAAAQDVLNGANTIGDCLFFHAGVGFGRITIGNQSFY